MAFCKYSTSFSRQNNTLVDNTFINEYLPSAPDMCVKVYLLGLSKCNNSEDENNSLSYFARALNICEDDVISVFKYWEDLGLVQVLSTDPVEVRYLPIISNAKNIKKYKVDKYASFNIQVQELFEHRMVMPNEFAEFYYLIEHNHIEETALINIIKYCIDNKGFNVSPNYAIVVAKNWEKEGVHTLEEVNNKIADLGFVDENMKLILSAMGSKRKPQLEDKELLHRWLNDYAFELNVIIFVVKNLKLKKKHLDINILDEYLTKYYEMKLLSIQEIENYERELDNMYQTAKVVNQQLGLRYDDLTKEIDTYILSWLNYGFDQNTLKTIAHFCFMSNIKTLNGFDAVVKKLFKLGITTVDAYMQYLNNSFAIDKQIKEILTALNLNRNVISTDRVFYNTWTVDWGFNKEIILYGASLSKDKANSIQYLNKVLADWHNRGFKTLDSVKNVKITSDTPATQFTHNNYTKEQIMSIMSNLDEVEV